MKNLINIAIVSLTLLISNYALANFQDGLNAYNKQDYATALKEWQPLAKQGNADRVCIILKLTPYFLSLFF
jgi:uncharacterized membrane protein YidH (DUF202 family)